jgi:co-chaperonin GroES (HSP10)
MAKTILMGDGKLTDEERANLEQVTKDQEQSMKEMTEKEIQKEKDKKKVTLSELLETTIRPSEDRVVVWRDPVELVTEGGILKPESVIENEKRTTSKGTVIIAGPGRSNENLTQEILCEILRQTEIANGNKGDQPSMVDVFVDRIKTSTSVYSPGDRILFGRFAGTPVEDPETGEELLIMRPYDIFSKL